MLDGSLQKYPAVHSKHTVWPKVEYQPGRHCCGLVFRFGHSNPAGHNMQIDPPREYEPGEQALATDWSGHSEPAGHHMQKPVPDREYLPTSHGTGKVVGSEQDAPAGHVKH